MHHKEGSEDEEEAALVLLLPPQKYLQASVVVFGFPVPAFVLASVGCESFMSFLGQLCKSTLTFILCTGGFLHYPAKKAEQTCTFFPLDRRLCFSVIITFKYKSIWVVLFQTCLSFVVVVSWVVSMPRFNPNRSSTFLPMVDGTAWDLYSWCLSSGVSSEKGGRTLHTKLWENVRRYVRKSTCFHFSLHTF